MHSTLTVNGFSQNPNVMQSYSAMPHYIKFQFNYLYYSIPFLEEMINSEMDLQ